MAVWGVLAVIAALIGFTFFDSLKWMEYTWGSTEEYGYGYIIPFLTLFLIWQRKDVLERIQFTGSWIGVVLVILGLILFYLGLLSTIYAIMQYAFLVVVIGTALSLTGFQ